MNKRQRRVALQRRLGDLGPASRYAPPHRGWIRAIRDALQMPATDLGHRMGIAGPSVTALEQSEQAGTARLDTLRRAAVALDCTLVYAFIPNRDLDTTVNTRAAQVASRQLAEILTTMALEDQAVDKADLLEAETERVLNSSGLWNDRS